MKMLQNLPLALVLVTVLATTAMAYSTRLAISSEGTVDGHEGYLMDIFDFGVIEGTFFLFEESGQIRFFAFREDGGPWDMLPPGTYLSPSSSAQIGASWTFLDDDSGQPSTSHLEAFEAVTVPAGTYNSAKCVVRLDEEPDSVVETMFFVDGVGLVREYWPGDTTEDALTSFHIAGGSGYFPLAVGNWWEYESDAVAVSDLPTSAAILHPSVPNPFNPSTAISFDMVAAGHARLEVYDVVGRLVTILVDGQRNVGRHQVTWDGRDAAGRMSVSGVYMYRLEAGGTVQSRRMMLVK